MSPITGVHVCEAREALVVAALRKVLDTFAPESANASAQSEYVADGLDDACRGYVVALDEQAAEAHAHPSPPPSAAARSSTPSSCWPVPPTGPRPRPARCCCRPW